MAASSLKFDPDNNTLPENFFKRVHGFISLNEAKYLLWLAAHVSQFGKIVEIGAYQGRSTIALALGAREAQARVWSIDHHPTYDVSDTHFSEMDLQRYYDNISYYSVGEVVRTINVPSNQTILFWIDHIDLLWIDGGHEYEQVRLDWYMWSYFADVVALHDTAGHHLGVSKLVSEILESGKWMADEPVDAITVFRRI